MLMQIDLTQFTVSEKLSDDDNDEFVFNLPHNTYLSHLTSNENNFVVVKEFPSISLDQFSKIIHSVESINTISQLCLAKVLGYFQGTNSISPSLIYTYYPLRSVKDLIKSFKSGNQNSKYRFFNGTHFLKICYGVAYAMNLLHSHHPQFVHRDLHAEKVLLNENYEPFVSGYGISEVNSNKNYVAPEIIGNSNINTDTRLLTPSDVYAYGIFVKKLMKTFLIISNTSKYNNQESLNCFKSLIKSCKSNNPLNRPKFSDILLMLDSLEFRNSLKSIQSSEFDEIEYTSYCKKLTDIQTENANNNNQNFNFFDYNSNSDDIDKINQINTIMGKDKQSIKKKRNFLSQLFGHKDDPESEEISNNTQQKLSTTQPIIQPKNGNIKYPAKVASQMIVSQPKGKPNLMNQSNADQFSNQNQLSQKLPPLPPHQSNQFNKPYQKSIFGQNKSSQISSQSSFSKPSTSSSNKRSNHLLANRAYNEINSSREETKKSLIFPSLQNPSRTSESFIDQSNNLSTNSTFNSTQNKAETDDLNEFDSLSKNKNNIINNRFINNRKPLPESISGGTRLLGPSLLHLGNSSLPGAKLRCADDIYDDALHNDRGDTVYLNIIRATKLFKEAADRGHIESMFRLAIKLMNGVGTRANIYESIQYFKKSWEVGQKSEGASRLAEIYLTHNSLRNISEGEKYLEEALRANDLYANYLVVKLFVENKIHNYLYTPNNRNQNNKNNDIESAAREALISLRFCLRREYKLTSPVFIQFAKVAPKMFINSIERDVASDPSAMFYIGVLCHQAIIDSPPLRAVSLLESSFSKNYKSAFDYFVCNNLKPSSSSTQNSCTDVIKGAKLAKSGREAEAIGFLRKGSEHCNWAPDYDTIHIISEAMKKNSVDTKPVLDLLSFYAENESGPAKEELGMILFQGINTERNASKGLFYLKSAYDDVNYEMRNFQFLRDNCPGFYSDTS